MHPEAPSRSRLSRTLCALAAVGASILSSATLAGDGAALKVLGFSPDGKRFAFEATGSEDASTFRYFRVTVVGERAGQVGRTIEHETDPSKTPSLAREYEKADATVAREAAEARVRLGVENAVPGLRLAESEAARAGEELLPLDIFPVMGSVVSELVISHPALGGEARIRLTERKSASAACQAMQPEVLEATLVLQRAGRTDITLFDGPADIEGAGCPRRYGLVAAHLQGKAGAKALAIVFQTFPLGFEEPDRRFGAAILPFGD